MKNKAISLLLAFIFLLYPVTAFASGDPNIDGGGGGMGTGTSANYWSPGNDGIRVSIVDTTTGAVVGTAVDYTNKSPSLAYHFGSKTKIDYRNGASLTPTTSAYQYRNPMPPLPTIVTSSGGSNVEAIKRYFASEGAAQMIAADFGIDFELLTSGRYKIQLEPIIYITYNGQFIGMTAHETALYDQQLNGDIRYYFVDLTHKNLPLAMFLERPDLGFSVFSGDSSGRQSNDTILAYLGIGTISYADLEDEPPPEPGAADVEYRVNTEVITSVTLHATKEINPDSPATVTFNTPAGTRAMSGIVIPEGESQVVWCKWTTPATEQTVTVTISTNNGYLSKNRVTAQIIDLDKNPPPDPKADDRNDSFSAVSAPSKTQITSARWTVWWAQWHPFWEWEEDWRWVADVRWVSDWRWVSSYYWVSNGMGGGYYVDNGYWRDYGYYYDFGRWVDFGKWVDNGWYDFFTNVYTANLTASSKIAPDEKNPTASGNTMKSGYGVNNAVTATLSSNAPSSHVTGAQNAVSWFPEFGYNTYWRLLDRISTGTSSRLEFKQNPFSTYNQRAHFTPVWYKNGNYTVYTWLIDAWTPSGMLSMNLTGGLTIQGSVFDDWQISPKN